MNAWTGPTDYGMLMLKYDDSTWTAYSTDNSELQSESVSCISVDKFNNKWIGTSVGLAVYNENGIVTEVEEELSILPKKYTLKQNYPNPFNPTTTIKYSIPKLSFVTLKVFDVLGNEVAVLVNEDKPVGKYEVEFDASNLSSGVYFYQIQAGDFIDTKKMILLK
jgi:hypothetical protein